MKRGLLVLVLAWLWFWQAAPVANAWIATLRVQPRGQRTAAELRALVPFATLPPETRALVLEAEAAVKRERDWTLIVASLLSRAERIDGLARAAAAPLVLGAPGHTLEPELPILVDAIHARYGPETAPIPPAPRDDDWPMIDRRMRARVLLALVNGPGLDDERAAVVLAATLDLLATQARRSELEAMLAEVEVR